MNKLNNQSVLDIALQRFSQPMGLVMSERVECARTMQKSGVAGPYNWSDIAKFSRKFSGDNQDTALVSSLVIRSFGGNLTNCERQAIINHF